MKKLILTHAIILSALFIYGCSDQQDSSQNNTGAEQPVADNAAQKAAAAPAAQTNPTATTSGGSNQSFSHPPIASNQQNNTPNRGIVEQVLHSGGYTYVNAKSNGKNFWLAGSQMALKEGQEIFWGDYAVMTNFKSKSLDKTFDEIYFVSGFSTTQPAAVNMAAAAPMNTGKVISAQNSAGYSYIEVDANGTKLWLAAPLTELKASDQITWDGGSKMQNFTSKSLNKTFKEILFVGAVQVANNSSQ